MEHKACPVFLSITFLVTLLYILQGVFSSHFIAGEYKQKIDTIPNQNIEIW